MELADLPGRPARAVAHRHKRAVEDWWTKVLEKVGVASAPKRARELVLLMEGATALILIHGDRRYAVAAADAARALIGRSAPPGRKALR